MCVVPNRKIKQVRWNKGILVTSYQFTSFTKDELLLLLSSLQSVYGNEKAYFINY